MSFGWLLGWRGPPAQTPPSTHPRALPSPVYSAMQPVLKKRGLKWQLDESQGLRPIHTPIRRTFGSFLYKFVVANHIFLNRFLMLWLWPTYWLKPIYISVKLPEVWDVGIWFCSFRLKVKRVEGISVAHTLFYKRWPMLRLVIAPMIMFLKKPVYHLFYASSSTLPPSR